MLNWNQNFNAERRQKKAEIEVRLTNYRMQANEIVRQLKVPHLRYDYSTSLQDELATLLDKQRELEWMLSK